jgi:hypothetical protein
MPVLPHTDTGEAPVSAEDDQNLRRRVFCDCECRVAAVVDAPSITAPAPAGYVANPGLVADHCIVIDGPDG